MPSYSCGLGKTPQLWPGWADVICFHQMNGRRSAMNSWRLPEKRRPEKWMCSMLERTGTLRVRERHWKIKIYYIIGILLGKNRLYIQRDKHTIAQSNTKWRYHVSCESTQVMTGPICLRSEIPATQKHNQRVWKKLGSWWRELLCLIMVVSRWISRYFLVDWSLID